jgi:hypothetical protein
VPKFVADSSVSPTGLKWAVDPVADVVTTAGDLIYGTAADTVARLGIGTAGQVLKVNSGATAPEWGAAAGGGGSTVKIHYANPSADFSSSSATTVDITGYSITFTPTSATNEILISTSLSFNYSGQSGFDIQLDGTIEHRLDYYSNTNATQKASTFFRIQNLSASSHTIKVRTNPNGSSFTAYGSGSFDFKYNNLMIQEIY